MFTVYVIVNLVNGKRYVGFTSLGLLRRFRQHLKAIATKSESRRFAIHCAMRKYGADNFELRRLATVGTRAQAVDLEQKYIKIFDSRCGHRGYNMTDGGDGAVGYRHTAQHKKWLSQNSRRWMTGRHVSNETRQLQRQLNLGAGNGNAREYLIRWPNGKEERILCLAEWAKRNQIPKRDPSNALFWHRPIRRGPGCGVEITRLDATEI